MENGARRARRACGSCPSRPSAPRSPDAAPVLAQLVGQLRGMRVEEVDVRGACLQPTYPRLRRELRQLLLRIVP